MMSSEPRSALTASGRSSPWVSEIRPIRFGALPTVDHFACPSRNCQNHRDYAITQLLSASRQKVGRSMLRPMSAKRYVFAPELAAHRRYFFRCADHAPKRLRAGNRKRHMPEIDVLIGEFDADVGLAIA